MLLKSTEQTANCNKPKHVLILQTQHQSTHIMFATGVRSQSSATTLTKQSNSQIITGDVPQNRFVKVVLIGYGQPAVAVVTEESVVDATVATAVT